MAKKKETRFYGQSYIPSYSSKEFPMYQKKQVFFYGLNRRDEADDGYLSECRNIDASLFPSIVPVKSAEPFISLKDVLGKDDLSLDEISIYGFDKYLFYVYAAKDDTLKDVTLHIGRLDSDGGLTEKTYVGTEIDVSFPRELAVFCRYEGDEGDIVYEKEPKYYLICMPDRVYIPVDFKSGFQTIDNAPELSHITVHTSRLFGAKEGLVLCSAASDFTNWITDSSGAGEDSTLVYNETNAWYSTTQSNTESLGDITAIVSYDGHPVFFKKDYMHQINNTKNPYRVYDIAPVGALSGRCVVVHNSVMYFISGDGVYRYSGGYPQKISGELNISPDKFTEECVLGAAGDVLYVYVPQENDEVIFTYGIGTGQWACVDNPHGTETDMVCFATLEDKLYSVDLAGNIYKYGIGSYEDWSFATDKRIMRDADDKRLHSFKMGFGTEDSAGAHALDSLSVYVVNANGEEITVAERSKENEKFYEEDSVRVGLRDFDHICHRITVKGDGYIKVRVATLIYSVSGKRYNSD